MEYKNLITHFVRSWNFTRSETLAFLQELTDQTLDYKPNGERFQKLSWEFGCLIRTQLVYTHALEKGIMDFSYFEDSHLPSKDLFITKQHIKDGLQKADEAWLTLVRLHRREEDFLISWPGHKMPLSTHIAKLMEHERLHHGQFITYFTLADISLPQSVKTNWAL